MEGLQTWNLQDLHDTLLNSYNRVKTLELPSQELGGAQELQYAVSQEKSSYYKQISRAFPHFQAWDIHVFDLDLIRSGHAALPECGLGYLSIRL